MRRRDYLALGTTTIGILAAGCLGGDNSGDTITDHDEVTDEHEIVIDYNMRRFDRIEHPETGEVFESDEDVQWVGLQLQITNRTDEPILLQPAWFGVYADGVNAQGERHESSKTEPLEDPIPAGETIETYFIVSIRPGRDIRLTETPFSQVDIGFRYDEDIEFAWQ